jgi:PhzF family phenazine biosynthesis protein
MKLSLYQIDAFADRCFQGNPAAVCPLEAWLPDDVLLAIAAENNLSETAFFVPRPDGTYELRWFTPVTEVDLCGHATLATAWLLLHRLTPTADRAQFHTQSGVLTVHRGQDGLVMDLPSRPPSTCDPCPGLLEGLGGSPTEVLGAAKYLVVYAHEDEVLALAPDMRALANIDRDGVIATAPGSECDFVSRYFVPAAGIDEDPVTGSAHCTLTPYWADRLGKTVMDARQVSVRGGRLRCTLDGARVLLSGNAVLYLEGTITI